MVFLSGVEQVVIKFPFVDKSVKIVLETSSKLLSNCWGGESGEIFWYCQSPGPTELKKLVSYIFYTMHFILCIVTCRTLKLVVDGPKD